MDRDCRTSNIGTRRCIKTTVRVFSSTARKLITHPSLETVVHTTAIDYSLMPGQKSAYIVLEVLPSYLQSRVRDRMLAASWSDNPMPRTWLSLFDLRRRRRESDDPGLLADEWKRVIWEVLGFTERLGAIASLVNFLVFLYDGR